MKGLDLQHFQKGTFQRGNKNPIYVKESTICGTVLIVVTALLENCADHLNTLKRYDNLE